MKKMNSTSDVYPAIPIVSEEAGQPFFTIGRSGGMQDPDFTLDGVGMQLRHCVIEDRGPKDGCFIQVCMLPQQQKKGDSRKPTKIAVALP